MDNNDNSNNNNRISIVILKSIILTEDNMFCLNIAIYLCECPPLKAKEDELLIQVVDNACFFCESRDWFGLLCSHSEKL